MTCPTSFPPPTSSCSTVHTPSTSLSSILHQLHLHQLNLHYKHHVHKLPLTSSTAHTPFTSLHQLHLRCIHHLHQKQNLQAMNFYISLSELLPVVPARGEAEVVLGLYYKTFSTYRTCICRAPVRPVRACFVRQ